MPPTASANGQATEEKELRKPDILFEGDKFIVPADMDFSEAIECLKRREVEEETEVNINEPVKCFPLDGAVALAKVLKRRYGWTNLIPIDMGFFGIKRPSLIGVEIGFNETSQIPWGQMSVPKIDGTIVTSWKLEEGMPIFLIAGTVKRKHERIVADIAREVREIVKRESIYQGKSVRINFRDTDGERKDFDVNFTPKFIDMAEAHRQEAIYSQDIHDAIAVNLYNPIKFTDKCRQQGIPLKRGILLGGPYGTGKTLAAWETAMICAKNGWTFLYLEDVRDLDLAIGFARMYEPCVLFAEDVDRAVGLSRDSGIDKILNTLDGITSKNSEIMVVLTTNHLASINPAFLRPGRIDTIIQVTPPDINAIVRMVRKYGQDKDGNSLINATDEDLREAVKCLTGTTAAFIREVVERSKLSAIAKENFQIGADDLARVSKQMLPHIMLLNPEHGKGMFEVSDDDIQLDPMQMATEILVQKFAEGFVKQISNPKVLEKIILKKMKRRGGGDPCQN